jgi:hypothetical protein
MKEKQRFFVDAGRPSAIASMLAFAISIVTQIIGYADRLNEPKAAMLLVLLPVLSDFLMIVVMLKFGKSALWLTVFPVTMGVLYFAYKLVVDPRGASFLHHFAAVILYLMIIALWALTVSYVIKTKWVLTILFILPFLKHVCMNDIPILLGMAELVPASMWMKEISMLCMMLALSLCAYSFEIDEF